MKMRYTILSTVGLFYVMLPAAVWSQQNDLPDALVHGGYGSGTATVKYHGGALPTEPCDCVVPSSPTPTRTTFAGIGALWSLDPLVGGMSLITRFSASNTRMDWTYKLPDALVLLPNEVIPVTQRVERRIGYTLRDFGLETLILFRPFGGLGIGVGGSIGYREITDFRFSQHLMEPANARFINSEGYPTEDQGRTLVYSDGSDIDFNPLALQAIASALYTIEIDGSVAIIPEVNYRIDLAAPITRSDWEWLSVSGLISFRYRR